MCLTIFHNVLKPSTAISTTSGGKKSTWRASISDSQKSMLLCVPTINQLNEIIEERTHRYRTANTTLLPCMLYVGTVESPTHFYVYFGGEFMKFSNFIQSLDFCFKLYQVWNLHYPKESELVWNFIQQHIFNIFTPFDTYRQIQIDNVLKQFN